MATQQDQVKRDNLPIPDFTPVGLTTFDAKDPDTTYPPIVPLMPPAGAPNVLLILIDDVGFGASSAFGGPCPRRTSSASRQPDLSTPVFTPPRSARQRAQTC
jgi:arylsulfatase